MGDKCKFIGKDYQPCQGMIKMIRGDNGYPIGLSLTRLVVMSDIHNDFCGGAVYRWSKKKSDVGYINFCPVCGVDIRPRSGV